MDNLSISRASPKVRKLKGFTLLEMIVVIAIIGILASIIIPNTVSRVRDSRIESANAAAKDIYFAVQSYCTDMQIRKIPLTAATGENAAFPFTAASNGKIAVGFVGGKSNDYNSSELVKSTSDRDEQVENFTQNNPDCIWGFIKDAKVGTVATGDINADGTNKNKGGRAITGISNYLGSSMGATQVGAFIALIDVDTYTVDCVVYSEQPTALTDCQSVIGTQFKPYTQIFGRPAVTGGGSKYSARSQEYDTLGGTGTTLCQYVGQYPLYATN